MTASAKKSSSTTRTASLPKSPDVARRHYLTQALRHRAALAEARASGADAEQLADIAESLADAKEMARRARSWGRRAAKRTAALPPPLRGAAARKSARLNRTAPVTARDVAIVEGTGTFRDPYDSTRFVTTRINRRVDVLASERSAKLITEAQFQVGRMIQAVYERASGARLGSRGWEPSGSRDRSVARDLSVIFALEDANRVIRFTARLERAIGTVGARFLRAILVEGQTFAVYAAARGRGGDRGTAQVAAHFRLLLAGLTEEQHTARAPRPAQARDAYANQAAAIPDRLERSAALAAEAGAAAPHRT